MPQIPKPEKLFLIFPPILPAKLEGKNLFVE